MQSDLSIVCTAIDRLILEKQVNYEIEMTLCRTLKLFWPKNIIANASAPCTLYTLLETKNQNSVKWIKQF